MEGVEDVFIQSLVAAGTCKSCAIVSPTVPRMRSASVAYTKAARRCSRAPSHRPFSTNSQRFEAQTAVQVEEEPNESRRQYSELVDTYDSLSLRESERRTALEHYRLAPRLTITPEQEDRPPHGKRKILDPIDEEHRQKLRRLEELLRKGPGRFTTKVWSVYFDLPTPRMRYISDARVRLLFRHCAWVEVRNLESSQRYFALLEDAISERVPIRADEWNTAIAYAGHWVRNTTSEDVKAAIETWLRMEREGGIPADNITFNILFDIAVKAGRFALADTIYAEMDRRKLNLNRYFRTSKIYYAGRRGDAENVRAAFRDLVAAGEIVDTAIMNCVIVSLIRCGEAASAEHVVGKMKLLHEQKFGTAALEDWRDKKTMGRQLDEAAQKLREDSKEHLSSFFGSSYFNDKEREKLQRAAPIAPDELTYRMLIQWHARVSGNLDKIRGYIVSIKEAGYKVQYGVFFQLFNGFHKHGGYAFTAWNRRSLEAYWSEYIDTVAGDAVAEAARLKARVEKSTSERIETYEVFPLDPSDSLKSSDRDAEEKEEEDTDPLPSHLAPTEFRVGPIMAALGAFYKCAGPKRMVEVWDEVQEHWRDLGDDDRRRIEGLVADKIREAGIYLDP